MTSFDPAALEARRDEIRGAVARALNFAMREKELGRPEEGRLAATDYLTDLVVQLMREIALDTMLSFPEPPRERKAPPILASDPASPPPAAKPREEVPRIWPGKVYENALGEKRRVLAIDPADRSISFRRGSRFRLLPEEDEMAEVESMETFLDWLRRGESLR